MHHKQFNFFQHLLSPTSKAAIFCKEMPENVGEKHRLVIALMIRSTLLIFRLQKILAPKIQRCSLMPPLDLD